VPKPPEISIQKTPPENLEKPPGFRDQVLWQILFDLLNDINVNVQHFQYQENTVLVHNNGTSYLVPAIQFNNLNPRPVYPISLAEYDSAYDAFYNKLLEAEGGYVNDPDDKGGETFMGIAKNYHPDLWEKYGDEFRNEKPSQEALNDIKQRYRQEYWNSVVVQGMTPGQAFIVADLAVNSGVKRAKQMIKQLEENNSETAMLEWRQDYYQRIVNNNPSQEKFLNGWNNRLEKLKVDAKEANEQFAAPLEAARAPLGAITHMNLT